ncbi:MAG: vanadium-dependent haloperoxidase, partial [Cyanobacteriota bacterium]
DTLQRPVEENTLPNKNMAISYGAYRALVDLFPSKVGLFNNVMAQLGYVPSSSTDTTKPDGVGNVAAQALLDYRHADGSNQLAGYADNTGYSPVNTPDTITNPNHWQPLKVSDGQNGYKFQSYLTPHWGQVVPFALSSGAELRPPAPNRFQPNKYDGRPGPSGGYVQQIQKLIQISANLTDREKVIAEYWADGPNSELPPGHWIKIGQYVSERDHHDLDKDVMMFFALSNAMLDSSIATWEAKRFYDYSRPVTQIRFMFNGKPVRAWGGPYKGTQMISGENWLPYQPLTVVTPPFAEYVSGHSTFSAAGAEILKRFTGSDYFGASHTQPAGSSRVEPNAVPAAPVTLTWQTF